MKKLINSIKNKFNKAVVSAKTAIESTSGEGYIDTGVKIIIGVVIGGVILAGALRPLQHHNNPFPLLQYRHVIKCIRIISSLTPGNQ